MNNIPFIKDVILQYTLTPSNGYTINKDSLQGFNPFELKLPKEEPVLKCQNLEIANNIKCKKIDELEEKITKLKEYIEQLKYRPPNIGGEYYEESKKEFENKVYL